MQVDGWKVREYRIRRTLTLRELSAKTGIGFDTISRIENGAQQPRISTIRRLAEALDVPAEELMVWGAKPPETGKAAA